MNKIYKVVWSKVKNCYVVVSEIAKNVITGAVKSAKVGSSVASGLAMGAAMASLMTQIFANLILGYVVKSLRKNNVLLMKGMDPRFLVTVVRDVVHKLGSRTKGEDNE